MQATEEDARIERMARNPEMLTEAEEVQMHQYLNSYEDGASVLTPDQIAFERQHGAAMNEYGTMPGPTGRVAVNPTPVRVPISQIAGTSVFTGRNSLVANAGIAASDAGGRPMTAAQRRDYQIANGSQMQTDQFENWADQSAAARNKRGGDYIDPDYRTNVGVYLDDHPTVGAFVDLAGTTLALGAVILASPETLGTDLVAVPLLADKAATDIGTIFSGRGQLTGLQMGVAALGGDDLAVNAAGAYQGLIGFGAAAGGPPGHLALPQGLGEAAFSDLSTLVRTTAVERGLGGDAFIQGSRAAGNAKVTSDLDIAIRLSPEEFDDFLMNQSRLGNANPGSAKARTLDYARRGIL